MGELIAILLIKLRSQRSVPTAYVRHHTMNIYGAREEHIRSDSVHFLRSLNSMPDSGITNKVMLIFLLTGMVLSSARPAGGETRGAFYK